mgnify:CR=1 FL=1
MKKHPAIYAFILVWAVLWAGIAWGYKTPMGFDITLPDNIGLPAPGLVYVMTTQLIGPIWVQTPLGEKIDIDKRAIVFYILSYESDKGEVTQDTYAFQELIASDGKLVAITYVDYTNSKVLALIIDDGKARVINERKVLINPQFRPDGRL